MPSFTLDHTHYRSALLALSMLLSFINCFYGYRLQKIWMSIICFGVGLFCGGLIASLLLDTSILYAALIGVVLGGILAVLSVKLQVVGDFSFTFGTVVWMTILFLHKPLWVGVAVGTLLGLFAGFLSVRFARPVSILCTSITGGMSTVQSFCLLLPVQHRISFFWVLCAGTIFSLLGIVLQYQNHHRKQKSKQDKNATKHPVSKTIPTDVAPSSTHLHPLSLASIEQEVEKTLDELTQDLQVQKEQTKSFDTESS